MGKTIQEVPKSRCTGCGACYNRCPRDAIVMQADAEGFLFPSVTENCVHCGLCLRVCPAENAPPFYPQPQVYAVWADAETRAVSSSGGAFSVLADHILQNGGAVCGAAYTEDYLGVRHTWVESADGLPRLRGSKYVQSDTGLTYRDVKRFLESGRPVLYTGCPCQIAGLRQYLGRDYPALYLADIVCHGAPSPQVYRSYLQEKAGGRKIARLDFREKTHWGWGTATSLFLDDGTVYRGDCYHDPYWRGFLGGLITRQCCGTCPYAQMRRIGDFSLGDFWGVGELDACCDDRGGTSLLLVNSPRARRLFERLSGRFTLCREQDPGRTAELAGTRNGQLCCPKPAHKQRQAFFAHFPETGFSRAFEAATRRYDVGYVGWWDSSNYGSCLTSFALNRTLCAMGKSVLMLEHPGMRPDAGADGPGIQFARQFYDCSDVTAEKDYARFNDRCDSFVVGSDQLWNWWCNRDMGMDYFFLHFADDAHRKIAYATSFGGDKTAYPDEQRLKASYYLKRFDAISVREQSGVQVCRQEFDVEAAWVVDPVFLCGAEVYREAAALSRRSEPAPYLFAYLLDPTAEKLAMVRFLARTLGLPYRIAGDALADRETVCRKLGDDPDLLTCLRIEDWLFYLQNAAYVVTDSFHGFCFSLIFEKNVTAIPNAYRGQARFDTIAARTGLQDRMVPNLSALQQSRMWETPIDHAQVQKRMQPAVEASRKWLADALETRRPPRQDVSALQTKLVLQSAERIRALEAENAALQARLARLERWPGPLERVRTGGVWLARKTRGGVRCLQEHGLRYTVRRFGQKMQNRLRTGKE